MTNSSEVDDVPLKLVAAADLHLGRRPARLPDALTDRIPARELGPAAAWEGLVDLALDEGVHAVLLAGDLVEAEDDFFEALRELRSGVERLVEGGVRVLAVAGNHDIRVLPYLAEELDGFELLGAGGSWERATVDGEGERATIHGWSFPRRRVRDDPVAATAFERGPGPNLGLLHADRDGSGSPYAPVTSRGLADAGLDGWLLGHIHAPDALEAPAVGAPSPAGYLGSVTGLDPGEPGPRGPWLLAVDGGEVREVTHRALAPLRWCRVDVPLDDLERPDDARRRILDALEGLDATLEDDAPPLRAVGVRIRFTGRTHFRREVADLLDREDLDHLSVKGSGVHYFVETVVFETRPPVDLEELAEQPDPAGLLARKLLLLDRSPGDPDRKRLVDDGRRRLERVASESTWSRLEEKAPDTEETAAWLRRAASLALDRLLAQREEP